MIASMDAEPFAVLTRLIALSPTGVESLNALVRVTCAGALALPPLPSEGQPAEDSVVADFTEQFATDVSEINPQQREAFLSTLGDKAFRVAALIFVADFVPRVQSGLAALELGPVEHPTAWDHTADPADMVLKGFVPMVGALRSLDPVTTEVVRLRGAAQHDCRMCKSRREVAALDAGGTESMYADIESYETATLLDERQRAALRYVDALIWTPSRIDAEVAAGVRAHFSEPEALELTLDVMRNAANKIMVAFGADAPRVSEGTERFLLGADGQPVFG
jgi:alkylhydroperoxidase family enzyme